jgi:hypothetical protein
LLQPVKLNFTRSCKLPFVVFLVTYLNKIHFDRVKLALLITKYMHVDESENKQEYTNAIKHFIFSIYCEKHYTCNNILEILTKFMSVMKFYKEKCLTSIHILFYTTIKKLLSIQLHHELHF